MTHKLKPFEFVEYRKTAVIHQYKTELGVAHVYTVNADSMGLLCLQSLLPNWPTKLPYSVE